jgi:hypothetical protein
MSRYSLRNDPRLQAIRERRDDSYLQQFVHPAAGKRVKGKKLLPPRTGVQELIPIVTQMHRDIKQIKEAQTLQGAQEYINRHGLQDDLEALRQDVDGDGIDDVLVRTKNTEFPYIINGYTTATSAFPYRSRYYADYPTKAARKEVPYKQYIDDKLGNVYTNYGLKRILNSNAVAWSDKLAAKGYKRLNTNPNISVPTVFKNVIMKPFMNALKAILKNANTGFSGAPIQYAQVIRATETELRDQLITNPALIAASVEGEAVFNKPEKEIKKLKNSKAVKEYSRFYMHELSRNRNENLPSIVAFCIETFVNSGILDSTFLNGLDNLTNTIARSQEWLEPQNNIIFDESAVVGNFGLNREEFLNQLPALLENTANQYVGLFPDQLEVIKQEFARVNGDPEAQEQLLNEMTEEINQATAFGQQGGNPAARRGRPRRVRQ